MSFNASNIEIGKVHGGGARSDMIWISVDKLSLVLHKHEKALTERRSWQVPAGLLVTVVTTFCTTSFRQAGFSADTWAAVFFMVALLSGAWLLVEVIKLLRTKSINTLVEEIKRQADGDSTPGGSV